MKIRTQLKHDSFNSHTSEMIDIERSGDNLALTFDSLGVAGGYKPRTLEIDADELERIMVLLFPEKQ